ncbi:uncharacterized protein LOC125764477 [Anopheles funestus]|uniref:uncharacterized protein LOC125764477 n=1 Tax=Anopheles funestus TaxID=62324 RepID=UPI0020C5E14E|nr:uncharacterized protein LOC125764477 [Anopheles funestus]
MEKDHDLANAITQKMKDYFGPIRITVGRRHEKRSGAIFTCLTTRAIHLEVVHSLTTASCILAIHRFFARRGSPPKIISDQGTNFVGAARELREALKDVDTEALMERFSSPVINWIFNPPSAPHFGGSWERLVQSVKKTLSLDLSKTPSDEQLSSTLTEIELIINCRSLTSDGAKPEAFLDDSPAAVKASWCAAQHNAQLFWKKWTEDYLPTLTRRTKRFEPVEPIAVGDKVWIIDGNLPRSCYPKGRVIAIVRARVGQDRHTTVQTNSGTIERPATKIAVSDIRAGVKTSGEKPFMGEIFGFLTEKLNLVPQQLEMVQMLSMTATVIVEKKSEEEAHRVVELNDGKHTIASNGVNYLIPLKMEDNTTIVQVQECPSKITNADLKSVLERYGEIKEAKDLYWDENGLFAGVKSATMRLSRLSFISAIMVLFLLLLGGTKAAYFRHFVLNVLVTDGNKSDYGPPY